MAPGKEACDDEFWSLNFEYTMLKKYFLQSIMVKRTWSNKDKVVTQETK